MKTIWVLEDGQYSGYRVIGVFTSRENAQLAQSKVGGEIGEWPLDPGVGGLSKGYSYYRGEMLYDGTVGEVKLCSGSYCLDNGFYIGARSSAPAYQGLDIQDSIYGVVLAKDPKHAIKIFNEKRIQLIASGEFKPPQE